MKNMMNTFEHLEVTFKNAEQVIDTQMPRTCKHNSGAEIHYTIHTLPTLQMARIGRFHEVEFTMAKAMPQTFLEQATVWERTFRKICDEIENEKIVGFVAIRMKHDSDLIDIAMKQSFIPTVDDTGIEMVIRYFPVNVDQRSRIHFITSSEKDKIERKCDSFGTIELTTSENAKIGLATCGQGNKNPGLRILAQRYEEMPLYGISVKIDADADNAPATFCPYVALKEMLMFVTLKDVKTRLVGIATHNRFEGMACLDAGFFPLVSEVDGEGIYIRYYNN